LSVSTELKAAARMFTLATFFSQASVTRRTGSSKHLLTTHRPTGRSFNLCWCVFQRVWSPTIHERRARLLGSSALAFPIAITLVGLIGTPGALTQSRAGGNTRGRYESLLM